LLSLVISKMFLPVLINTPWVYQQINTYLLHLLGEYFSKKDNMFIKCVFTPIIFNDCFYFAIDREKLLYFKSMFDRYRIFSHIFENLPSFDTLFENFNKNLPMYDDILKNLSTCSPDCLCHWCHYKIYQNLENMILLERQCCSHHF